MGRLLSHGEDSFWSLLIEKKIGVISSTIEQNIGLLTLFILGGRHSSMVSSVPTILRPQVQIPSTPSMLFSICIIEIVSSK